MTGTGIVRRIDGLGRVVIPKELRKTMKIREGDLFEMNVNEQGQIILNKFSLLTVIEDHADQYVDSLSLIMDHVVCITDREKILSVSTNHRKLLGKRVSDKFRNTILERKTVNTRHSDENPIQVLKEVGYTFYEEVIIPIVSEGDVIGALAIMEDKPTAKISETEEQTAIIVANIIGRQLENQVAS